MDRAHRIVGGLAALGLGHLEVLERVLRSIGRMEHNRTMLVLDIFNLVAAFSRARAQ